MTTQFIEITSLRRDRNKFPEPASFEIQNVGAGQKDASQAVDPVSLAAPSITDGVATQWNGFLFNAQRISNIALISPGSYFVDVVPESLPVPVPITNTNGGSVGNAYSDTILFVNTTSSKSSGRGALQLTHNYYRGAMLCVVDGGSNVLLTTADALLASVTTAPKVVGVGIGAGAVSIAAGEASGGSGDDTIAFNFNMGTGAVDQTLTSITVTAGSGYSVGDVITVPQATLTAKFNAIAPGASASSDLVITLTADDFETSTEGCTDRARIAEYEYIGNDRAKIVLLNKLSTTIIPGSTVLRITDPTDLDKSTGYNPAIFVPDSPTATNYYIKFRIYNITRSQSRPIKSFDPITHIAYIDTSGSRTPTATSGPCGDGSGAITNWGEYDLYSMRREAPITTISILDNDTTTNNPAVFNAFNLTLADANTIPNPNLVVGGFLEIQERVSEEYVIAGNDTLAAGGTTSVTLNAALPGAGTLPNNSLNGAQIRMKSGNGAGQITTISAYNAATRVATLNFGFNIAVNAGDTYDIYTNTETRRITKYVDYRDTAIGGSVTTLQFPVTNRNPSFHPFIFNETQQQYYTNLLIRITGGAAAGDIRTISDYTIVFGVNGAISATVTINPAFPNFSAAIANGDTFTITSGIVASPIINPITSGFTYTISNNKAYILPFSYDNEYPFNQNDMALAPNVNYQMELINLILPNQYLDVGFGSLISFYQYVYVEIQNAEGNGITSGGANNIPSNNPNAVSMTFRATIDDVPNPVNSTFIKIDGDGMSQTLKFNPNQSLKFSVYLGHGGGGGNQKELFKTRVAEWYSPSQPNPIIQISAMFRIKPVSRATSMPSDTKQALSANYNPGILNQHGFHGS
jgi:hypothetical protein